MSFAPAPTTVVLCHRLAEGTTPEQLAARDAAARGRGLAVTWTASLDGLGALAGSDAPLRAVADEAGWWASRATLRERLSRMIHLLPGIDTLVVGGGRPLLHRELLRDHGIRTACVDRFDDAARGSRRPAPAGWDCRSLSWGLWEVAVSVPRRGWLDRLTGREPGPRTLPGGLTVLATADASSASGPVFDGVARLVAGGAAATAVLATLPNLVSTSGVPATGSVLRAA